MLALLSLLLLPASSSSLVVHLYHCCLFLGFSIYNAKSRPSFLDGEDAWKDEKSLVSICEKNRREARARQGRDSSVGGKL